MNARQVSFTIAGTRRWSILSSTVLAALVACGGGDPEATGPEAQRERAAAATGGEAVQHIRTRDAFAFANYFEFSNDCQQFAVEVFAFESRLRSDATATSSSTVHAQLSAFDACTGSIAFMSGVTDTDAIKIRNDLTHAQASATVVMQDEFGASRTLVLNLAWNGGVITFDQNDKVVTITPVSKTVVKTFGQARTSDSVSGSLVLDGVDLLAPGRPLVGSGINGFVTRSKGSTIEIVRTR